MSWFLAVPVEEPATAGVASLLATLRAAVPGVRWVRPEGVHLTLRFLANLDPALRDPVAGAARRTAARVAPWDVELSGLGTFPDRGPRTRVLWLGTGAGRDELVAAGAALDTELAALPLHREDRELRPHCTLGRPRAPWPDEARAAWRAAAAAGVSLRFTGRRIVLFESVPGPRGSVHEIRAEAPLAAAPG